MNFLYGTSYIFMIQISLNIVSNYTINNQPSLLQMVALLEQHFSIYRWYNGLSSEWCQAIVGTNAVILLIRTLRTNFNEILSKLYTFSVKKMHLKMSSEKWRPFCLGLDVSLLSLANNAKYSRSLLSLCNRNYMFSVIQCEMMNQKQKKCRKTWVTNVAEYTSVLIHNNAAEIRHHKALWRLTTKLILFQFYLRAGVSAYTVVIADCRVNKIRLPNAACSFQE